MLNLFGRRKKKPRGDVVSDALADLKDDQKRKAKRRKRRGKQLLPSWVDRRMLIGLGIILIAIIADGVRRENEEFYANITKVYGQVQVYADAESVGKPAQVGDKLQDRNIIRTGAQSGAVLEFPDDSVVTVGANSQMVVKLLEYNRGGAWRARSFFLQFGQVWARVSPHFGEKSEIKIYTPSSVAAVRGTTFSVYQGPRGAASDIMCSDGTVAAQGLTGAPQAVGANTCATVSAGKATGPMRGMSSEQTGYFRQPELWKEIPEPHWLKTVELTITQTLDAPLTILGIGKASPYVGCANFARRTAAQEQLRRLYLDLEGAKYPKYINPGTMEQLDIPGDKLRIMLSTFHGDAIELYRQLESGRSFIVLARARDTRRTLYKVTPYGVDNATEAELRQYQAY